MGGALAIFVDGELVANLWGGIADERDRRARQRDTASVIFSCTKGLMSLLVARLVEQGRLDYAAPVARYWPEFAANGKGSVTVAEAFSHRAGLSAPVEDLELADILDWDVVTSKLAAQAPLWPPGEGYAYHALTHGWLAGELVRRVTGQSPGAYFRDAVAPLGAAAWIGAPALEWRRRASAGSARPRGAVAGRGGAGRRQCRQLAISRHDAGAGHCRPPW